MFAGFFFFFFPSTFFNNKFLEIFEIQCQLQQKSYSVPLFIYALFAKHRASILFWISYISKKKSLRFKNWPIYLNNNYDSFEGKYDTIIYHLFFFFFCRSIRNVDSMMIISMEWAGIVLIIPRGIIILAIVERTVAYLTIVYADKNFDSTTCVGQNKVEVVFRLGGLCDEERVLHRKGEG